MSGYGTNRDGSGAGSLPEMAQQEASNSSGLERLVGGMFLGFLAATTTGIAEDPEALRKDMRTSELAGYHIGYADGFGLPTAAILIVAAYGLLSR